MIQAGSKVNIIPERCTFSIDRRMMPGETSESVRREIEEVFDKAVLPRAFPARSGSRTKAGTRTPSIRALRG